MNQIVIKGRLTRSPELKTIQGKNGETSVCSFSVAVNRRFGEETDFFDCQAWGKAGEFVNKNFQKGQEILISGEMQCHPYENKEGKKVYPWRIKTDQIEFCGSKKDNANSDAPPLPEGIEEVDDDDLPF
ncbi:single-stranded DNA-binding protein [Anaerovorax odorimutans]|uniref:single-stranded DNA-binding protein n=1 Tax=Anaerovorax odorimutans TaxID=109327 RepID=UPI0004011893|nr:single-stranded DNA-binding protein [Anaerovorax odorimutans]